MTWFWIALLSYFVTGLANVIDKLVLTRFLKAASIYAFYVGVLGIIAIFLAPFGFEWTSFSSIAVAFASGVGFVVALYTMYSGFLRGETTRAASVMGGTLPITTVILSYLVFGEVLRMLTYSGIILLIIGVLVIGLIPRDGKKPKARRWRDSYIFWALLAGVAFGVTYTGTKLTYEMMNFITGFIWINIGSVVGSLALLLKKSWRDEIVSDFKAPKVEHVKSKSLMLFNQSTGALGFILLNYAISLGPVSVINAMQGAQYAFVFIIGSVLGLFIEEVRETRNIRSIVQKVIGIILITLGLTAIAICCNQSLF
jgi:drug/metabolite transporter (DMT)-like permease